MMNKNNNSASAGFPATPVPTLKDVEEQNFNNFIYMLRWSKQGDRRVAKEIAFLQINCPHLT